MAYTNAIYYLDLVNGVDASRTALTTCVASNPSETITRITKNGHGLVSGAVVLLAAFTAWLNGYWKISYVDDNNFDLVGAVWQATADTSGTVTPSGGSSWIDAWKTFSSGATATRIAPGDVIRVAKTADPVSIGDATWTSNSNQISVTSSLTTIVDSCEIIWSAAANVTPSAHSTSRKVGSYCSRLNIAALFATGQIATHATGTLILSTYSKISFWIKASAAITGGKIRVDLHDTTDGTGAPIDSFTIPVTLRANWMPLTIAKNGGGTLGASIKSVALYAISDPGTVTIDIDHIIACNDLTLNSLIGKNTTTETWYGIRSIDAGTVTLDNSPKTISTTTPCPYMGASEVAATYTKTPLVLSTVPVGLYNTGINSFADSGVAGNLITYEGGYNITNTIVDGLTFIDGLGGDGYGFDATLPVAFIKIKNFGIARANYGFTFNSGNNYNCIIENCHSCNNDGGGLAISSMITVVEDFWAVNNASTGIVCPIYSCNKLKDIYSCGNIGSGLVTYNTDVLTNIIAKGNTEYGVRIVQPGVKGYNVITSNNTLGGVYNTYGAAHFFNSSFTDASPTVFPTMDADLANRTKIISIKDGQVAGTHKIYDRMGTIAAATDVRHTASGCSWKFLPIDSTYCCEQRPMQLQLTTIIVSKNTEVAATVWVYRSNTEIYGKLICPAGQVAGLTVDTYETSHEAAADWEQLSVTISPTEDGVVELYLEVWGGTAYSVYVDDVSVVVS
jgi:hypothetical protein